MLRNIKCTKNVISKACSKRDIEEIYYKIDINNNKLILTNTLQNKLKRCIEDESIEKILKFKMEEINEDNIDYEDAKYKKKTLCKLNPDVCKINIKLEKSKLEKLDKEVKSKIDLYNKDLLVLEKLKNHYLSNEEVSKDIYLKFGRDKNDDLIALYFDVKKFIKNKSSIIYLFSQNQDFFNPSVLFLKYEDYIEYGPRRYINEKNNGYALICDIRIVNKRIGHGTFMLSNIEPIIKKVNKDIRYINKNIEYDDYIINEIVAVNGMICPGSDTTYDDLVKFYNINGYPTYSNGNIENRNIYKEI